MLGLKSSCIAGSTSLILRVGYWLPVLDPQRLFIYLIRLCIVNALQSLHLIYRKLDHLNLVTLLNCADTNVTTGTSPACHASSYASSISVTQSSSTDKRIPATATTSAFAVRTRVPNWTYCNVHTVVIVFFTFHRLSRQKIVLR